MYEEALNLEINQLIGYYDNLRGKTMKGRMNPEAAKYLQHILQRASEMHADGISKQKRIHEQQQLIKELKKENKSLLALVDEQKKELEWQQESKKKSLRKVQKKLSNSRLTRSQAKDETVLGSSQLVLDITDKSIKKQESLEESKEIDSSLNSNTQEIAEKSQKIQKVKTEKIPKYNSLTARRMSLSAILDIYVALTKRRTGGDAEEAKKILRNDSTKI